MSENDDLDLDVFGAQAVAVLREAIEELCNAAHALDCACNALQPVPSRPRSRRWRLTPDAELRITARDVVVSVQHDYPYALYVTGPRAMQELAETIARQCRYRPRSMLRALRRLQAAAAWCRAREAGVRRQAADIMRAQAAAADVLRAEAAMRALRR